LARQRIAGSQEAAPCSAWGCTELTGAGRDTSVSTKSTAKSRPVQQRWFIHICLDILHVNVDHQVFSCGQGG
jgi:hypothetical protein